MDIPPCLGIDDLLLDTSIDVRYDYTGRGALKIHRFDFWGKLRDLVSPVGTHCDMTDPGRPAPPTIAALRS